MSTPFIFFSSLSSSYYRSPYLDLDSNNSSTYSSSTSSYAYPSYESKYDSLISRNPEGAGKSRSGSTNPTNCEMFLHFVAQEPPQNMTICPATAATTPMTRLRTTSPPTMPVLLIRMNSPKTILRNTTTSRLVPGTVF